MALINLYTLWLVQGGIHACIPEACTTGKYPIINLSIQHDGVSSYRMSGSHCTHVGAKPQAGAYANILLDFTLTSSIPGS